MCESNIGLFTFSLKISTALPTLRQQKLLLSLPKFFYLFCTFVHGFISLLLFIKLLRQLGKAMEKSNRKRFCYYLQEREKAKALTIVIVRRAKALERERGIKKVKLIPPKIKQSSLRAITLKRAKQHQDNTIYFLYF